MCIEKETFRQTESERLAINRHLTKGNTEGYTLAELIPDGRIEMKDAMRNKLPKSGQYMGQSNSIKTRNTVL